MRFAWLFPLREPMFSGACDKNKRIRTVIISIAAVSAIVVFCLLAIKYNYFSSHIFKIDSEEVGSVSLICHGDNLAYTDREDICRVIDLLNDFVYSEMFRYDRDKVCGWDYAIPVYDTNEEEIYRDTFDDDHIWMGDAYYIREGYFTPLTDILDESFWDEE